MIQVACGVMFTKEGHILMGQRNEMGEDPLSWEFPGGKCKKYESLTDCLHREWKEELNLDIIINKEIFTNIYEDYECIFFIGAIPSLDNMEVRVHNYVKLCSIDDLRAMNLMEGDEKIIEIIESYVHNSKTHIQRQRICCRLL